MAGKTVKKKAAERKASSKTVAVTCQCENKTNSWSYGLIIGVAFGVLAGAITGNYVLWLPICTALGLMFGQFFKC